jgi:hypothetical protein
MPKTNTMKHIINISLLLLLTINCRAQSNDIKNASRLLQQVQKAYTEQNFLSFSVSYRLTATGVADSLKGNIKMSGNNYLIDLDSSLTIHTGIKTIVLFKEDKLLYVTKGSNGTEAVMPLAITDSSYYKNIAQTEVKTTTEVREIAITFKESQPYKKMFITIDRATNFITHISYAVPATMLQQATNNETLQKLSAGGEAIIEIVFAGYSKTAFDPSVFYEDNYYKKDGDVLVPVDAYADYTVYGE